MPQTPDGGWKLDDSTTDGPYGKKPVDKISKGDWGSKPVDPRPVARRVSSSEGKK